MYTIDDGTGVVDCAQKHGEVKSSESSQAATRRKSTTTTSINTKPTFSDYLLSARAAKSTDVARTPVATAHTPPKPIAHVSQSVAIVGQVNSHSDFRTIAIKNICTYWLSMRQTNSNA